MTENHNEESYLEKDCIEIDEELDIDQGKFLNILMGTGDMHIDDLALLDYFTLFQRLEMTERAYLIAKEVEKVDDLENLVAILNKTFIRFELQGNNENNETKSAFTVAVLNSVRGKRIASLIPKHLQKKVEDYNFMRIEDHKYFSEIEDFSYTHEDIVRNNLSNIHKTKEYHNVILKTADGGETKAHREILIWKSRIFHEMIKSGGKEAQEMEDTGVITLNEDIGKRELEVFLEYIYTGAVTTEDSDLLKVMMKKFYIDDGKGPEGYEFEYIVERIKSLEEKMEKKMKIMEEMKERTDFIFSSFETIFDDDEKKKNESVISLRISNQQEIDVLKFLFLL